MSATLLYHMLGIRGYKLVKQNIVSGGIEFIIDCHTLTCPVCGSTNVWRKGHKTRSFKSVPIGSKKTTIILNVPRIHCHDCQAKQQVHLTFAEEHKRYTRFLATHVLDLLLSMTCQDVAEHLGMSWDTVRDIEKTRLKRDFAKPPLKDVTHIAIDEIAVQKRHKYLTVVMDLKTGRVIFVGDGKDGDALLPFWKRLKRSRANIIAVCSDMSPAYTKAIKTHLPDAIHVFDRFHVMKLFNAKLTDLRRRLYGETKNPEEKSALKGIRFDLLKREPDEKSSERLEKALSVSADLAVGYALKEQLYELWEADDETEAFGLLVEWIEDAEWSQIPEMQAFAKTLRNHWQEILNYHYCELTSGPLEGLNNKIKTLKRQSYGFRDQEYFKLKILAIHRTRYALVG
jgi:Transposase and inactivated derivatives